MWTCGVEDQLTRVSLSKNYASAGRVVEKGSNVNKYITSETYLAAVAVGAAAARDLGLVHGESKSLCLLG